MDRLSQWILHWINELWQDNEIKKYSTHSKGKPVIAERFIRALKSKVYDYMTSISKNLRIDKLDGIVNKYKNTYSTIKMKLADAKSTTHPRFEVGNHVRITKFLWLKKVKTLCCRYMLLVLLTVQKLYCNVLQKRFAKKKKESKGVQSWKRNHGKTW